MQFSRETLFCMKFSFISKVIIDLNMLLIFPIINLLL